MCPSTRSISPEPAATRAAAKSRTEAISRIIMPIMRFLFLRHGRSTYNVEGRIQGWSDAPLDPAGLPDVQSAAAELATLDFSRVISSDLRRAHETAKIVASYSGLGEPQTDAGLRERNFGDWQDLTPDEIERAWPGAWAEFRSGSVHPPGGETPDELRYRVATAVRRLSHDPGLDRALIVAHGGPMRALAHIADNPTEPLPNLSGIWFELDESENFHRTETFIPSCAR